MRFQPIPIREVPPLVKEMVREKAYPVRGWFRVIHSNTGVPLGEFAMRRLWRGRKEYWFYGKL